MNLEKFTDRARGFLQSAQTVAMRMNHQRITPAHLLKALLEDEQGMAAGPDRARRRQRRGGAARDRRGAGQDPGGLGQRRAARRRRSTARRSACSTRPSRSRRRPATATSPSSGCCSRWSLSQDRRRQGARPTPGVKPEALNAAINELRGGRTADTQGAEDRYDALKKFARDLTQAARDGKLDPVIGRDEEIRRTIQILARRTKNNPVLIGEPGVGKTAIAEGPGAAHRQWRRARQPQGPAADGARHGLADRRRQISRRVRGAAEGRARRGQGRRGRRSSCSSTRCTR